MTQQPPPRSVVTMTDEALAAVRAATLDALTVAITTSRTTQAHAIAAVAQAEGTLAAADQAEQELTKELSDAAQALLKKEE